MNKDIHILSHLRKNARATLTDISKNTNVPVSTVFDRLRAHEKHSIIKHTTLVDFTKFGFHTKAMVALKTEMRFRMELKNYLLSHPSVNNLFLINNNFDYMIEIVCRNQKELNDFFEELNEKFNILDKQEHIIIEDIQREVFWIDGGLK